MNQMPFNEVGPLPSNDRSEYEIEKRKIREKKKETESPLTLDIPNEEHRSLPPPLPKSVERKKSLPKPESELTKVELHKSGFPYSFTTREEKDIYIKKLSEEVSKESYPNIVIQIERIPVLSKEGREEATKALNEAIRSKAKTSISKDQHAYLFRKINDIKNIKKQGHIIKTFFDNISVKEDFSSIELTEDKKSELFKTLKENMDDAIFNRMELTNEEYLFLFDKIIRVNFNPDAKWKALQIIEDAELETILDDEAIERLNADNIEDDKPSYNINSADEVEEESDVDVSDDFGKADTVLVEEPNKKTPERKTNPKIKILKRYNLQKTYTDHYLDEFYAQRELGNIDENSFKISFQAISKLAEAKELFIENPKKYSKTEIPLEEYVVLSKLISDSSVSPKEKLLRRKELRDLFEVKVKEATLVEINKVLSNKLLDEIRSNTEKEGNENPQFHLDYYTNKLNALDILRETFYEREHNPYKFKKGSISESQYFYIKSAILDAQQNNDESYRLLLDKVIFSLCNIEQDKNKTEAMVPVIKLITEKNTAKKNNETSPKSTTENLMLGTEPQSPTPEPVIPTTSDSGQISEQVAPSAAPEITPRKSLKSSAETTKPEATKTTSPKENTFSRPTNETPVKEDYRIKNGSSKVEIDPAYIRRLKRLQEISASKGGESPITTRDDRYEKIRAAALRKRGIPENEPTNNTETIIKPEVVKDTPLEGKKPKNWLRRLFSRKENYDTSGDSEPSNQNVSSDTPTRNSDQQEAINKKGFFSRFLRLFGRGK